MISHRAIVMWRGWRRYKGGRLGFEKRHPLWYVFDALPQSIHLLKYRFDKRVSQGCFGSWNTVGTVTVCVLCYTIVLTDRQRHSYEHPPDVDPQSRHTRQVPARVRLNPPQSEQISPDGESFRRMTPLASDGHINQPRSLGSLHSQFFTLPPFNRWHITVCVLSSSLRFEAFCQHCRRSI